MVLTGCDALFQTILGRNLELSPHDGPHIRRKVWSVNIMFKEKLQLKVAQFYHSSTVFVVDLFLMLIILMK